VPVAEALTPGDRWTGLFVRGTHRLAAPEPLDRATASRRSRQSTSKRTLFFPRQVETGRSVLLAIPPPFTHNSQRPSIAFGGIHVCCPVREFPARLDARNRARSFDVACGRPGLHPRPGASVQRRCVSPVQFRNSGCRPRQGLHGQEQIAAQPRLPRVLQTRGRGYPSRCGEASQHQAGNCAKARQRQIAKVQEAGEATRNLTAARACIVELDQPRNDKANRDCTATCLLGRRPRAAARTRFVRPRPQVFQGKADGADARTGRMQLDRASARKKSHNDSDKRLPDSIFASAATHGVTQKPTPLKNQGLRHN
jgi:hypothetical protein